MTKKITKKDIIKRRKEYLNGLEANRENMVLKLSKYQNLVRIYAEGLANIDNEIKELKSLLK